MSRLKIFIAFAISISLVSAFANNQEESSLIVKKISFRGVSTISEEVLRSIVATKIDEEIVPEQLTKDTKNLYKDTGLFSDISVDVKAMADGGLEVIFVMVESPKIRGKIELIGNNKITQKKLRKVITLGTGEVYSDRLGWETKEAILRLYREKGYYLATVEISTELDREQNQIQLTFEIDEGKRIKIAEINFIGAKGITPKKLLRQLKSKIGKSFDEELFEYDLNRLGFYYKDHGYIHAKVSGYEKRFNDEKTKLMLDVPIDEGIQFVVRKYQLELSPSEKRVFTDEKILELIDPAEGEIFNQSQFQKSIAKLNDAYQARGYILATIAPVPNFNEESGTVDITLQINEGEVVVIGELLIYGLEKTKEYVVRRELELLDLKAGSLLDVSALRKARQRIFQMGPFIQNVDFTPIDTGNASKRNLQVSITESTRTGMFTLGGGYGSEGGFFGTAEIGNSNLWGRAYQLHLKGELGNKSRQNGELRLSTPWAFGKPTRISTSLYNTRRQYYSNEDIYTQRGLSLSIGRPILKNANTSIRFKNESTLTDYVDEKPDSRKTTRSLEFMLSRDTRDYRMSLNHPIGGLYNSLSYEYSGGLLGADNQFQKYTTEFSFFINTWRNMVIASRLRIGSVFGDEVPSYERYFLGGIDTIRGYDDYEVVPTDDGSEADFNGGNKMLYFNLEYRIPIASQLIGVLFFDAGQTWKKEWDKFSFDDLRFKRSIGAGVRFDLQGMQVRLESGYGFDRPNSEWKFHFTIGPGF